MLKEIRPAIVLIVGLTLITGLGLSAGDDRHRRSRSRIRQLAACGTDGKVIGSELIGQNSPATAISMGGLRDTAADPTTAARRCRRRIMRPFGGLESRPDQQGVDRTGHRTI